MVFNLTPCIPLSLARRGGRFWKRGFAPLGRPLVSLSLKGEGERDFREGLCSSLTDTLS